MDPTLVVEREEVVGKAAIAYVEIGPSVTRGSVVQLQWRLLLGSAQQKIEAVLLPRHSFTRIEP